MKKTSCNDPLDHTGLYVMIVMLGDQDLPQRNRLRNGGIAEGLVMTKLICDSCNQECATIYVDLGIGSYDYGDGSYTHTDYQEISECCEGDYEEVEDE